MSGSLPIVMTAAGLQPQAPADLRAQLVAAVAATNPGYTANLPGSLIEDVASTDVAAIVLCDQARVELVNSLTPLGTNQFLLGQLGQQYGIPQGDASNTSAFVVFTGPPGYVLQPGFTVADGLHQYVIQDGGVIGASGTSNPLFVIANESGSWAVPANTIDQIATSVPSTSILTVTNPDTGTPGGDAETVDQYRVRVLQAIKAAAAGMPSYLRTQLELVPGVQARLVSIRQITGGGWQVICGGGDPYATAQAIYLGVPDFSILVGSVMAVEGITTANPGVVTTVLNHGYVTGQAVTITGIVGMTGLNGIPQTVTVLTPTTFSIGNTAADGSYVSGGVCSPNARNIVVSLSDPPDTYLIPFVNPPAQAVHISLVWNTSSPNFVSDDGVAQLGSAALVSYVNSLTAGQAMNLFELQQVFQLSLAAVLAPQLLTRMVFSISIDGIGVAPSTGTGIIAGDPESYFLTDSTQIQITRG